jgi:hypothetical protein
MGQYMVDYSVVKFYYAVAPRAIALKLAASISSAIENDLLLVAKDAIRVEM